MLLAGGPAGLMMHRDGWRRIPCPLPCPEMLARDGDRLAVLDNTVHAVWTGRRVIPVDSGVEAMLLWQDSLLTLSGDTDCLTLHSLLTGEMQLTIPAGIYPQGMCLLPGRHALAVCGGADGLLRIIRLPELQEEQAIRLHGSVERAACMGGAIYTLCAIEDDGLCCQLCRLQGRTWSVLAQWPGLPGAIHADAGGRLWVAASERLCCLHQGQCRDIPGDFGLIRHMNSRSGAVLASDPVMDTLWLAQDGQAEALRCGGVQHALLI